MKEPDEEGVASHLGPESCAGRREVAGEALTGGSAGPVLSCDIKELGVPMLLPYAEGKIGGGAILRVLVGPRAVRDPEHAWTFSARNLGDPGDARG